MYADIVVESLNYCVENKGLQVHAWVIMSNHLHLIASSTNEDGLSANIRDFKKFTSQKICKAIENNKQESRRNWVLWLLKSAGADNKRNETYQRCDVSLLAAR
ncbi:MAG: transposase [Arcicella sp.]|nr:transposase [Arcicella sp.]